ncbi:MAG: hypothetical protein J5807_00390, partial [Kiritimatiellae bacterium]|nr:hypothetical protein [Kiritimatiellia bacterium]
VEFGGTEDAAALLSRNGVRQTFPAVVEKRQTVVSRLQIGQDRRRRVVVDPEAMGGPAFGRILRGFMAKSEGCAYGMAQSLAAVPDDVRHLALCGRAADVGAEGLARFSALDDVRLISPRHPKKWLAARAKTPCIRVFCGEFSRFFPEGDAEGLTVVGGAAEFIPDWPRLALSVDVGSGTTGQTVVR